MATKYRRSTSVGNTNWSNASNWSDTAIGGAAATLAPTSADDVVFGAASLATNIDAAAACLSADFTGYTNTFTHNGFTWSVYGSLTLASGMTYTIVNSITSIINFSAVATGKTITFAGKTLPGSTFGGVGGGWTFQDAASFITSWIVSHQAGTLNFNGKTCSFGYFFSNGSGTRTLTLGAATITCSGTNFLSNSGWNANATGLTLSAASASITLSGTHTADCQIDFGGGTYNSVIINSIQKSMVEAGGGFTASNTSVIGTAAQAEFVLTGNINSGAIMTWNGSSTANRLLVRSNLAGTQRTITSVDWGVFGGTMANVDWQDINLALTNAPSLGYNSVGDGGGNSGTITFTTPVNLWAKTAGNFTTAATWATSSGGSAATTPPLLHDTLVFDSTAAAGTYTADMARIPKLTCTTFTRTLAFSGINYRCYGDVVFVSGATITFNANATFVLVPKAASSFTSGGKSFGASNTFEVQSPRATLTFTDAFVSLGSFTLTNGTMAIGSGIAFTCLSFSSSNSNTRALTLAGSTLFKVTGSGTVWDISTPTGFTLTCATSTIEMTDTTATTKNFYGGGGGLFGTGVTYYIIKISGAGTGGYNFSAGLSSGGFNCDTFLSTKTNAYTLTFGLFQYYVANTWTMNGSSGNIVTITGDSGPTFEPVLFCLGTVPVLLDYMSITNILFQYFFGDIINCWGATNSTDGGGNHNINFYPSARRGLLLGVGI